jgi:hypothetical protein
MKKHLLPLLFGALALAAASAASARVDFNIGIDPFGYGPPPPVVYQPAPAYDPYYVAPPAVYIGGGGWGGDRGRRDGRGRGGHDRGHR